jgi:hypothetical protein
MRSNRLGTPPYLRIGAPVTLNFSVTLRYEFVELDDLMFSDAAKNIGQPDLGIEAVEFRSFDISV